MMSLFVFIFGTIVGSFLNVCIYRLPKEESVVFPGSHCGVCGKAVRWHDNIPVLSYFMLRGRCRDCGVKFSIQYALVEVLTGVLFILFYRQFGFSAVGILYLVLALALLTQSAIDWAHKIIPDSITLPGIVLGLVASAFVPALHQESIWWRGLLVSAFGVLLGGGFLYFVAIVAERILKREAMGGGDVKLLAMIGAFLGIRGVLWTIFFGSFLGSFAGIYFKVRKKEAEIPFGPFLGLAAFLYLFFGVSFIDWYFNLMVR